jgi:hypothetical protein
MRQMALHPGSAGPFVRDLQMALNSRLNPSPNLMVNGIFDAATGRAVRAFQTAKWLQIDGIAGPATLDALYDTEQFAPILHNVAYISQPTPTTCWAAATAMIKHTTVGMIRMATPASMLTSNGSLINESEAGQRLTIHQSFSRLHGLRYYPPQSWSVQGLLNMIRQGPLMLELLWNARSFSAGTGSAGHYVVVIGARGSHAPDGSSTTLRIYNPDPAAIAMESISYRSLLRNVPLGTFGIMTT